MSQEISVSTCTYMYSSMSITCIYKGPPRVLITPTYPPSLPPSPPHPPSRIHSHLLRSLLALATRIHGAVLIQNGWWWLGAHLITRYHSLSWHVYLIFTLPLLLLTGLRDVWLERIYSIIIIAAAASGVSPDSIDSWSCHSSTP